MRATQPMGMHFMRHSCCVRFKEFGAFLAHFLTNICTGTTRAFLSRELLHLFWDVPVEREDGEGFLGFRVCNLHAQAGVLTPRRPALTCLPTPKTTHNRILGLRVLLLPHTPPIQWASDGHSSLPFAPVAVSQFDTQTAEHVADFQTARGPAEAVRFYLGSPSSCCVVSGKGGEGEGEVTPPDRRPGPPNATQQQSGNAGNAEDFLPALGLSSPKVCIWVFSFLGFRVLVSPEGEARSSHCGEAARSNLT